MYPLQIRNWNQKPQFSFTFRQGVWFAQAAGSPSPAASDHCPQNSVDRKT